MGFSLRQYSFFLFLLAYGVSEAVAGPLTNKNAITPSPSNSLARRAASIAARQDEDPDPGWLVENFVYLNVGNSAGQFYLSFALQQVGTTASSFCTANAESPKPPAWSECRNVLIHGPDPWVRFQFDRDTYTLSLNQTWGYSWDQVTETIFTSVGSTKLCPGGPGQSSMTIDSSSADGNNLRVRQGDYCFLPRSLGRTENEDSSDVHMEAGIECCIGKVKIEGTVVSKVPGQPLN
ncbi:hypothetical protein PG984_002969 [Apiospora sp. TS-2023a]